MFSTTTHSSNASRWPALWWVLGIAVGLLLLNLYTAGWMPLELVDEVLLSDAGVNLAQGHGFISTAWPDQSATEFFGGNLPLYPSLLTLWFKALGFSLTVWRGFSYVSASLAAVFFSWAFCRLGWLRTREASIWFVAFAFVVGPGFEALRLARYDAFHMLLLALTLLAWSLPPTRLRLCGLCFMGVLLIASGIQPAFYAGIWCLLALCWQKRAAWSGVLALGIGVVLGGAAVALLWQHQHAWAGFLGNMTLTRTLEGERGTWRMLFERLIFYPVVLVNFPLMVLAYFVAAWAAKGWQFWRPLIGLSLLAVVLQIAIHFRFYYYWMVALPLAFAIAYMAERGGHIGPLRRSLLSLVFALLALYGPGKLLFLSWAANVEGQRLALAEFAQQQLKPRACVLTEWSCYSAVKPRVAQAFFPSYLRRISPEEAQSVDAVLVHISASSPSIVEPVTPRGWMAQTGARWEQVAQGPRLQPRPIWKWLDARFPDRTARYLRKIDDLNVVLYRRVE